LQLPTYQTWTAGYRISWQNLKGKEEDEKLQKSGWKRKEDNDRKNSDDVKRNSKDVKRQKLLL
jgi:hypothetical protein